MSSIWGKYDFEGKIRKILSEVQYGDPNHHFGRPYITAYQIAIEFAKRFPEAKNALPDHEMGGKGLGKQYSFSQYIAQQLSQKIKSGQITDVEGSSLGNLHLAGIQFKYDDEIIKSSMDYGDFGVSIYRLIDNKSTGNNV